MSDVNEEQGGDITALDRAPFTVCSFGYLRESARSMTTLFTWNTRIWIEPSSSLLATFGCLLIPAVADSAINYDFGMSPTSEFSEKSVSAPIPEWPPKHQAITESVMAAMQNGDWGKYHSQPIEQFTKRFGDWLGVNHVWPCSSGTIAVELALRGCGVKAGDQVVMAGYDFPGNFRAVEAIGARPLLIDVVENGYVADMRQLALAIGENGNSAVLISHLHGQLQDVAKISHLCDEFGVALVEDACQVPGAIVGGHLAGTQGDVGVFSFGGSKLLTAGRGGAVVCKDEATLQRIRISAERGNDAYPFSALQAAALLPQLDLLAEFNSLRLKNSKRIRDALMGSKVFSVLKQPRNDQWSPAFYKYPLLVKEGFDRQSIIAQLRRLGVPADSGFRGFTKRSKRRCDRIGSLENSSRAASQTILLHHPVLLGCDELIEQIIAALKQLDFQTDCGNPN